MLKHSIVQLFALLVIVVALCAAPAVASVWQPTAGGTYDFTLAANWDAGTPNAPGAVADAGVDITGSQTLQLQQDMTVGTLNLGDANASGTSYAMGLAGPGTLTLQAAGGGTASFNMSNSGTTVNTISANINVGSNLAMNFATTHGTTAADGNIKTTGNFNVGSNTVTATGGFDNVYVYPLVGTPAWYLQGDLAGDGKIVWNAQGGLTVTNANNAGNSSTTVSVKSFTGTIEVNSGLGGATNNLGLSTHVGSLANAAEVILNGHYTAPAANTLTQEGGGWWSGNGTAYTYNPGQRFTQHTITMNGGTLAAVGQQAPTTGTTPWSSAQEMVVDNVNRLHLNSGFNVMTIGAPTSTAGTRFNVTNLDREAGATIYVRSGANGLGGTARLMADNGTSYVIGSGAAGTTTVGIVPWITAATNSAAAIAGGWATYDPTYGVRTLATAEYASGYAADVNLKMSSLMIAGDNVPQTVTINSLYYNGGGVSNLGGNKVLAITSGGILFSLSGGGVGGATDDLWAGTVDFGMAEGIVWSTAINVNYIGAAITGSGGLTKAGTGTLILDSALSSYSGKTSVGGGVLQVGVDGTDTGTLGMSEMVEVASGCLLKLVNDAAILDSATVRLDNYGLFKGKVELASGLNETVGALFFGDAAQLAGTYGATGSGATYSNDSYFAGSGIMTVVPEPATMALLAMGGVAMLRRRR